MNKKEYTKPEFEVIESSTSSILAGSGGGNYNENLRSGTIDEAQDLEQNDANYIWAE